MAYTYGGNFNCVFKNGNATSIFLCRIGYELRSQDASTLTSVVNLRMEATTTNGGTYKTFGATRYSTIDGARVADATFDVVNTNQWVYFGDRTITIQHNADGTWSGTKSGSFTTNVKSVSAFSNWSLYSGSCSVTFTLPPIEVSRDMNIRLGDNVIKKAYVGTTEVKEVFYGDINIFPGYTRLEYIQSSGTQYINTGILCTDKIMMKIKFINLSVTGNTIIGNMGNPETDTFRFFNATGVCYLDYGSGTPYNRINGGNINANTLYELEVGNRYVKNLVTGNNIVSSSSVSFSNKSYNIFVNGNTAYSSNKWYYVKIYSNSDLVRDFIPVKRKTDNKVGLYDLVEHKFYGNNGSGDFIAGPEV